MWVGDSPAPSNYRTEELIKNLNLSLSQHCYLETGDTQHQINPLLGAPDYALPARVLEYISHEVGILRSVSTPCLQSHSLIDHQVGAGVQGECIVSHQPGVDRWRQGGAPGEDHQQTAESVSAPGLTGHGQHETSACQSGIQAQVSSNLSLALHQ